MTKRGRKVYGNEDPYSQENREMFNMLVRELRDLKTNETYVIPIQDYESSVKMMSLLHAVSKRLKWEKINDNGIIRSYLTTVKFKKLYIHRLG